MVSDGGDLLLRWWVVSSALKRELSWGAVATFGLVGRHAHLLSLLAVVGGWHSWLYGLLVLLHVEGGNNEAGRCCWLSLDGREVKLSIDSRLLHTFDGVVSSNLLLLLLRRVLIQDLHVLKLFVDCIGVQLSDLLELCVASSTLSEHRLCKQRPGLFLVILNDLLKVEVLHLQLLLLQPELRQLHLVVDALLLHSSSISEVLLIVLIEVASSKLILPDVVVLRVRN